MSASRDYHRGYKAGRRRLHADRAHERSLAARSAFWQRAYLAALPCALNGKWVQGDKNLTSTPDRSGVAAGIADEALKLAIERGHL